LTSVLDFCKMAIRPIFFKEICFTISLKNGHFAEAQIRSNDAT